MGHGLHEHGSTGSPLRDLLRGAGGSAPLARAPSRCVRAQREAADPARTPPQRAAPVSSILVMIEIHISRARLRPAPFQEQAKSMVWAKWTSFSRGHLVA